MQLVRTTLRLKKTLKEAVEKKVLEESTTFQEIFNRAIESYLENEGKKTAKKIVFKTHDLGKPLDKLTRDEYYSKPK